MKAYCLICREEKEIKNPKKVITGTGRPATDGACSVGSTIVLNEDSVVSRIS